MQHLTFKYGPVEIKPGQNNIAYSDAQVPKPTVDGRSIRTLRVTSNVPLKSCKLTASWKLNFCRDCQYAPTIAMELSQVRGERIFLRPICGPPQMRKGNHAISCTNQRRNVLRRMARRLDELDGGRELKAFRRPILPDIIFVNSPAVVKTRIRK